MGEDKGGGGQKNSIPLPFIPSHQGTGKFLGIHLENVRRKFSDLKWNNLDKLQCFIGGE